MPRAYYNDWLQAHLHSMGCAYGDYPAHAGLWDMTHKTRDEVNHVAIGNHWYRWLRECDGLDPVAHYAAPTLHREAPRLRPPLKAAERKRDGFSDEELALSR